LSPGSGYVSDENLGGRLDWAENFRIMPYLECTADGGDPFGCLANGFLPEDEGKYVYYKPFSYKDFLLCPCFYQSSDYQPFGALVPPGNTQYPTAWDSRSSMYKQPLFYEPPRFAFDPPYQARMGELHSPGALKQLFARSYGVWHWEWDTEVLGITLDPTKGGQYRAGPSASFWDPTATRDWDIPTVSCPVNADTDRQERGDEYCYVRPIIDVENIRVNDKRSTTLESGIGTVKLSFTVKVDPDQLPLTAYSVDWGDGNFTSVSGVVLRNRSNPENPFVLYHLYDYWQMLKTANQPGKPLSLNCPTGGSQCTTKVRVKATDNWGAQSGDATETYIIMNGEVTVSKPR